MLAFPLLDSRGDTEQYAAVLTDVTDERAVRAALESAAEAIRMNEERQRAMLTAIPDQVFRLRGDGVILDFHAHEPGPLLAGDHQVVGETLRSMLPSGVVEILEREVAGALQNPGRVGLAEYELELEQPRNFEGRVVASGTDEVVAIVRDVTSWKENEAALREARRAAEAASEAKSAFLANMSHEIRTPMNAVLGYTQLLIQDGALAPGHREQVAVIQESGEHLLTLINSVLEMSKIEAGYLTTTSEPLDLHALLEAVLGMFRPLADSKCLKLELDLDASVPRHVRGDPAKVRQVVINLLGNALKFTDVGGVDVRARSEPAPGGRNRVVVAVTDTGCGLAPENRERVFEAFEQLAEGRSRGGTGLGLPISRKFARLMGGDVVAEAAPDGASRFTFSFVAESSAGDHAVGEPTPIPLALARTEHRRRVLVVDDDPVSRTLLRRTLVPKGFEMREATSGEEALLLHANWRPHVVLTDLRMPGMGGVEAIRRMRGADGSVVNLAVSSGVLDQDHEQARAAGADDFLTKPLMRSDLFGALERSAGLEFIRAPRHRVSGPLPPVSTNPPVSLEGVPSSLLRDIRDAAAGARVDRLSTLVDDLEHHAPLAAAQFRRNLESFRYDALLAAVEMKESA